MSPTETISQDRLKNVLDWAGSQGGFHQAGNLGPEVLKAMAGHATRVRARVTAETGCGLSTILLSTIAECHICFTVAEGNPLDRVQSTGHLRDDRVTFVIGPSQLTLSSYSFARPLDFVLIDGAHSFPFPQLDYFHFYPHIRKGGVLVVDDIHIPTIRQMYDFLRDEKMWTHIEDVATTAFFQRTEQPMFDPLGGGWQWQQFNQRHFSDSAAMDTYAGGWRESMPPSPGPLLGAGFDALTDDVSATINGLRGEVARLQLERDSLRSSTSWRLTAPLRALASLLIDRTGRKARPSPNQI